MLVIFQPTMTFMLNSVRPRLFDKIYPYPTASAVNKRILLHRKEEQLTGLVKKGLHLLYRI
jgi:hypothetical protein